MASLPGTRLFTVDNVSITKRSNSVLIQTVHSIVQLSGVALVVGRVYITTPLDTLSTALGTNNLTTLIDGIPTYLTANYATELGGATFDATVATIPVFP